MKILLHLFANGGFHELFAFIVAHVIGSGYSSYGANVLFEFILCSYFVLFTGAMN